MNNDLNFEIKIYFNGSNIIFPAFDAKSLKFTYNINKLFQFNLKEYFLKFFINNVKIKIFNNKTSNLLNLYILVKNNFKTL